MKKIFLFTFLAIVFFARAGEAVECLPETKTLLSFEVSQNLLEVREEGNFKGDVVSFLQRIPRSIFLKKPGTDQLKIMVCGTNRGVFARILPIHLFEEGNFAGLILGVGESERTNSLLAINLAYFKAFEDRDF